MTKTNCSPKLLEERVRKIAGTIGLHLTKNEDGNYSLMPAGDNPRTIAVVATLEQAHAYLVERIEATCRLGRSTPALGS